MPDGDKIHKNLARRYQSPYKKICEGQISAEHIAATVCQTIKNDIKEHGNGPLEILCKIAECLENVEQGPLMQVVNDWNVFNEEIEQIVQHENREAKCGQRVIGLVTRAAKQLLESLRQGETVQNISLCLNRKYLDACYRAEFEGRAPLADKHHNGVDQATVDAGLQSLRPYVNAHLDTMAARMTETKTVDGLRLRRRNHVNALNVGTDLDDIGN